MVRTRAAAISLETFRRNSRTAVIKCKGIKFAAADICARLHALPCHAGCTAAAVANLAAARRAHAAAITAAKAAFVEALPSLVKLMQDTELASNAAGIHRLVSMCHAEGIFDPLHFFELPSWELLGIMSQLSLSTLMQQTKLLLALCTLRKASPAIARQLKTLWNLGSGWR